MIRTIKAWENGREVEIRVDKVLLTSRGEIVDGQDCETKRWLRSEAGPERIGVQGRTQTEEIMVGIWTHRGVEMMMRWAFWGELGRENMEDNITRSAREAAIGFEEEAMGVGMVVDGDEEYRNTAPEWWIRLVKDGGMLVEAMVILFGQRILPELMEKYELVAVEEEIPWVLGRTLDGMTVVVMTKPDAVLRDKVTGKYDVLELKTRKVWRGRELADTQGIVQLEAVAQRWGRGNEGGSVYVPMIKGGKAENKYNDGLRQTGHSLTRPWVLEDAFPTPNPEDLAWDWQWYPEQTPLKKKTLGKYWGRRSLDEIGLTVQEWLEMVEGGEIKQPGETHAPDWLAEVVGRTEVIERDAREREQWKKWALRNEDDWWWLMKEEHVWSRVNRPVGVELTKDNIFPLLEKERDYMCFNKYGHPCPYAGFCHSERGDDSLEKRMADGKWQARVPHHGTEIEFIQLKTMKGDLVDE